MFSFKRCLDSFIAARKEAKKTIIDSKMSFYAGQMMSDADGILALVVSSGIKQIAIAAGNVTVPPHEDDYNLAPSRNRI